MRNLFVIFILLSCMSCSSVITESFIVVLESEFDLLPYVKKDTIFIKKNTLVVCFTDSIPFSQPHIESEQLLFIFRKVIPFIKMDSVEVTINYPNRHYQQITNTIETIFLRKEIDYRFKENEYFEEISKELFYDQNSRYGYGTLVLLNYLYGKHYHENQQNSVPYDENSFELLFKYTKECSNNIDNGDAGNLLRIIIEDMEKIPSANYPKEKIIALMKKCPR
ncbi:MAG: hypothetical protein JXR57_02405 [Bacteroidales bacterium]|nr:hypothetical protein [Bacteroidales bacterium]